MRNPFSLNSACLIASLVLGAGVLSARSQTSAELERGFLQPPSSARPRTLWMWMNGNVTSTGITHDLEAMRRAGLGGALIFNIGEYIPKGPVDYGSEPWQKLVTHAAREADRLGLDLAMHNCPGWSSSGGPWITPEMSMQQLVWSETKIVGPAKDPIALPQPYRNLGYYRDICVLAFPSLPGEERPFAELAEIPGVSTNKSPLTDGDLGTAMLASPERPLVFAFAAPFEARAVSVRYTPGGGTVAFTLEAGDDGTNFHTVARLTPSSPRAIEFGSLAESFEPVRAKYFRLVPARSRPVCEVELHRAARIGSWNTKANFAYRAARQESLPAEVAKEFAIDPAAVRDVTRQMDAQGQLKWEAPAGAWTILRIGHTARGQQNIAAPDAGIGLECDKMSRAAVAFHFERGLGKLMDSLGPLAGKSFTGLEVDSYEVGMQNWTAGFEKEFKARNGYDLTRYLPAMTGRYVGSAGISERFLWDLRRTQAEMVADYYYGQLRAICSRHKLKLFVEPYGAGPGAYDELQIAGRADIPMGEFWAHFPWDDTASVRLAASASHIHGKKIVAGEAFTATEQQSRFLDHPWALKTTGDLAFSLGLNRMYFHRFAHQPHPTAVPGMTMGPWGFNFDRNNTWFEKSSPWLEYLARCQFLLQQGAFVADVLYFTGEGSPQMSKRLTPDLPFGYNFDAVDAEVLNRAAVRDGRIALPGGGSYRVLLLPSDLKSVTPELLRKLRDLVREGATLAGPRPAFSPTLRSYPASDAEMLRMADELWGAANEVPRKVGRGQVFGLSPIAEVLAKLELPKDFSYSSRTEVTALVWLHRRVDDTDIYFVANRQRRNEEVVAAFRVTGKRPELWEPDTGRMKSAAAYQMEKDRVLVPLRFEPGGSVFVVFRAPADPDPVTSLTAEGVQLVEMSIPLPHRPAIVNVGEGEFTVATWIKPDSDINAMPRESLTGRADQNNKSYVVPVPTGNEEAMMGIAAGRNGVVVIEGSSNAAPPVLVSRTPISGWTHLAIVYRGGKPSLYLNGRLDHEGLKSGQTVHPGVGLPPPPGVVSYFDGDMTPVEVYGGPLDEQTIAGLAAKGLPVPNAPPPIELERNADGTISANVWRAGNYSLGNGASISVPRLSAPVELRGPWQISFSEGSGAPAEIKQEDLVALQKHTDPGVKYFSGTAIYRKSFEVSADAIAGGKRLWLDLGRVAVIAEVRVNGRAYGTLWKPPFRAEITGAVRPGPNELEVRVTTLLVNRLIGDEQLPPENEYDPRTRAIVRLPDWFNEGRPKPPGGRVTFATWRFYTPDEPLVESGLLGPVRLLTSVTGTFAQ